MSGDRTPPLSHSFREEEWEERFGSREKAVGKKRRLEWEGEEKEKEKEKEREGATIFVWESPERLEMPKEFCERWGVKNQEDLMSVLQWRPVREDILENYSNYTPSLGRWLKKMERKEVVTQSTLESYYEI